MSGVTSRDSTVLGWQQPQILDLAPGDTDVLIKKPSIHEQVLIPPLVFLTTASTC